MFLEAKEFLLPAFYFGAWWRKCYFLCSFAKGKGIARIVKVLCVFFIFSVLVTDVENWHFLPTTPVRWPCVFLLSYGRDESERQQFARNDWIQIQFALWYCRNLPVPHSTATVVLWDASVFDWFSYRATFFSSLSLSPSFISILIFLFSPFPIEMGQRMGHCWK